MTAGSFPSVSVVITNHNYRQYLPIAIDSVLGQSHPARDVIVVDDGSVDGSADVIASYKNRVTAIFGPNRGQAVAMNRGFGAARGDVVVFLDADDYLAPDHLGRIADAFAGHTRVGMVQARIRPVGANGEPLSATVPYDTPTGSVRDRILMGEFYNWAPTSAHAYRTDLLERVIPIPDQFRLCADYYINNLMPLLGDVITLSDATVHYRIHGRNGFALAFGETALDLERLSRFVDQHGRLVEEQRRLLTGPGGSPVAALHSRNAGFLRARLCLWRFQVGEVREQRPLTLCAQGVVASLKDRRLTPASKAMSAAWFVVILAAPRRLALWTAEQFYCKGARTPLARKIVGVS